MSDTTKQEQQSTRIPEDVLQWLGDRVDSIEYGEVGFTLVIVAGEVKRVRKIDEEQRKA